MATETAAISAHGCAASKQQCVCRIASTTLAQSHMTHLLLLWDDAGTRVRPRRGTCEDRSSGGEQHSLILFADCKRGMQHSRGATGLPAGTTEACSLTSKLHGGSWCVPYCGTACSY